MIGSPLLVSFFTLQLFLLVPLVTATPHIRVLTPKDNRHLAQLAEQLHDAQGEHAAFSKLCHMEDRKEEDTSKIPPAGRQVGVAVITEELAMSFQQAAGTDQDPFLSSLQKAGPDKKSRAVVCSLLTESSTSHTDRLHPLPLVSNNNFFEHSNVFRNDDSLPQQQTAFVFLQSNPDAYFSYHNLEYPVVQGHMLVFDGDIPHHTTILHNGTTVQLLGPWDTRTGRAVGSSVLLPIVSDMTMRPQLNISEIFGGLPLLPSNQTLFGWALAAVVVLIGAAVGGAVYVLSGSLE